MSSKSNIIAGLDVGTSVTSVVAAEVRPEGDLVILGVGTSPSQGLRKGVVINIDATVDSIHRAVEQAEKMAGSEIGSVFASLSGSHIKGFNSNGIVAIKAREVSVLDVDRVIEAARAVAIPLDREVLHVLPQDFIIDGQDGIKEPLGISGVRLEARVHIVTGAVASAQNIVKCANKCGLAVRDIVYSGIASGTAALTPEEQELGICVVDIGGGTTDLAVYHGGAVKHTSVIPIGGAHITNDIASGLRTPISAAESMKCEYGSATTHLSFGHETLEVPSTGGHPPRILSRSVLAEIIEPRIHEIFSIVQKELVRSGCKDLLTSGLVITGGTSSLSGIAQAAQEALGMPVRCGKSLMGSHAGMSGLSELISSPALSAAAGLVRHAANSRNSLHIDVGQSKIARRIKNVARWIGEHF